MARKQTAVECLMELFIILFDDRIESPMLTRILPNPSHPWLLFLNNVNLASDNVYIGEIKAFTGKWRTKSFPSSPKMDPNSEAGTGGKEKKTRRRLRLSCVECTKRRQVRALSVFLC